MLSEVVKGVVVSIFLVTLPVSTENRLLENYFLLVHKLILSSLDLYHCYHPDPRRPRGQCNPACGGFLPFCSLFSPVCGAPGIIKDEFR